MDMLEAWMCFLKDPDSEIVKELAKKHDEIRAARELLIELSKDPEVIKQYNERVKVLEESHE